MRVDDGAGNGADRYCSPRHVTPFNSINEGSRCVSMTWRATFARPYLGCHLIKTRGFKMRVDDLAGNICFSLPAATRVTRIYKYLLPRV